MDTLSLLGAVREGLPRRTLLAVSGGRDSMALLEAAVRVAPERVVAAAAFDHGTGPAARAAFELVRREARRRGVPFHGGRAQTLPATEAAWRAARWSFLRRVARELDATVATAHTRDDQLETVLMRALRGAGARGLAGLAAHTGVVRPFLDMPREAVAEFAAKHGVRFATDPSNASLAHLRNRVRLELLPVLLARRPQLAAELLTVARRAAAWRREVEEAAAAVTIRDVGPGRGRVAREDLTGYDPDGLCVLWPPLLARLGIVVDGRGTRRLAAFTREGRSGSRAQLAGGIEVRREGADFVVGRLRSPVDLPPVVLRDGAALGPWRFSVRTGPAGDSPWAAALSPAEGLIARPWRGGDRVAVAGRTFRRVKRFLREARVPGADRSRWPVVELGGTIVWVPGVCRSDAATDRSGGPTVHVVCERTCG